MFADVVNWTMLARRLEMEDLREVNLAYQRVVTSAVEQFEGYVARYMGDGVLAVVGFPPAHEGAGGGAGGRGDRGKEAGS